MIRYYRLNGTHLLLNIRSKLILWSNNPKYIVGQTFLLDEIATDIKQLLPIRLGSVIIEDFDTIEDAIINYPEIWL